MTKNDLALQRMTDDIANNEIDRVLSDLLRLGRDSAKESEILLLISRFNNLKQSEDDPGSERYNVRRNNIIAALIHLLEDIKAHQTLLHIIQYEGIKYAIGLDFGDAETSIAYVDIHTGVLTQPSVFSHNLENSIMSALLLVGDDFLIGEQAIISCRDPEDVSVNFKKSLKNVRQKTISRNISYFNEALFDLFYAQHPDINKSNSILYVGHPSSWDEAEIALYTSLFRSIPNLPAQVAVVSESRSALICARDHSDIPQEVLQKCVLVIDIGSSTTDFTLLKNGEPKELANGKQFGCRLMDLAIKEWAIANVPDNTYWSSHLIEVSHRSYRQNNYLTLLCRIAKESIFGGKRTFARPETAELIEVYDAFVPILQFALTEAMLRSLILSESISPDYEGKSWEQSFLSLLQELQTSNQETVDALLITGGGSKMPFIQQYCQDVFEVPEIHVYSSKDTAVAVAIGLAGYGKWSHKLRLFHENVRSLCENEINRAIKINALDFCNKLNETILPLGYDKFAKPRIRDFINGKIGVDELDGHLFKYAGQEVAKWLNEEPDGQQYKEEISRDFIEKLKPVYQKSVNSICETYDIPTSSDFGKFDFTIPANLLENQFTNFLSRFGTRIVELSLGQLSVERRKKLLSWVIDEKFERVLSFMYATSTSFGIWGAHLLEWFVKKVVSNEERIADISMKTTPFFKSAVHNLQTEFSNTILKKAEAVELFIK